MTTFNIRLFEGNAAFDADNKLLGPSLPLYQVRVGHGLTIALRALKATINGTVVQGIASTKMFGPNKSVYRDIAADGTWVLTETAIGAPAPAVTAGGLRVGVSTTDNVNVIDDTLLCTYFRALETTDQATLTDAQVVANVRASQYQATEGGIWTGVAEVP